MKRKLLVSIVLGIMLTLGLAGCGDREDTHTEAEIQEEEAKESSEKETQQENIGEEVKDDENAEPVKIEEKDVEEEEFWKSRENLTIPSFDAVAVEEKVALDGKLPYKLSATPFHYDLDNLEEVLGNNEYINGIYNISRIKTERMDEFETFEEGDFHTCTTEETIIGRVEGEENFKYFRFDLTTHHKLFHEPNKVYLKIYGVPQTNLTQNKICDIAEDVFGKEIAEYLVYSPTNAKAPGKDDRLDFYGEVKGPDGASYSFRRDLDFLSKEDGWSVAFTVELFSPSFSADGNYPYDDGGKEPLYNSAKYTISDITENGLSNADFNNFSTMWPEYTGVYAGGEFMRNGMSGFDYSEEVLHNGDKVYDFCLWNIKTLLKDVQGYKQPELHIQYTIKENEEGIYDLYKYISSDNVYQHVENRNDEEVLACMIEQASVIMPYADFSQVIYNPEQEVYKVEGTHTLMGIECVYSVKFKLYSDASWNANVNEKRE